MNCFPILGCRLEGSEKGGRRLGSRSAFTRLHPGGCQGKACHASEFIHSEDQALWPNGEGNQKFGGSSPFRVKKIFGFFADKSV